MKLTHAMTMKALCAFLVTVCGPLHAHTVEVTDAWVRSSVPGQQATGAFMKITAEDTTRLVAASSPAAGLAEVHEMKMQGQVMTMHAVEGGLTLPAGKTVELKPGGYHIMLMDLKAALPKDSTILLTLVFKDAKGTESTVELKVPVALAAPHSKTAAMDHTMHGNHPAASH